MEVREKKRKVSRSERWLIIDSIKTEDSELKGSKMVLNKEPT